MFSSTSSNGTGAQLAQLQNDLNEFVALLNSHKVEYLVVGGHAVAFHGHPRFTGDIDFFIRATSDNAARTLEVLNAFGLGNLGIAADDLLCPERVPTFWVGTRSFATNRLREGLRTKLTCRSYSTSRTEGRVANSALLTDEPFGLAAERQCVSQTKPRKPFLTTARA
jgi:hypothetical protein